MSGSPFDTAKAGTLKLADTLFPNNDKEDNIFEYVHCYFYGSDITGQANL